MDTWKSYAVSLGVVIFSLWFAGCGNSPPSKFYVLSATADGMAEKKIREPDNKQIVAVGPIEIPSYLNRPEIVTRSSKNVLSVGEFDLWGGPLQEEITRVLVENLSLVLSAQGITAVNWRAKVLASCRIPIVILRFDAQDKTVTLHAQWNLSGGDGTPLGLVKEIHLRKDINGEGYANVVDAMNDALAEMSSTMANDVRTTMDTLK